MALSRAAPWPAAKVGIARASGRGDCHGLSRLLGGGARGGWLRGIWSGSKVSMMIMGPPQQGQGCLSVCPRVIGLGVGIGFVLRRRHLEELTGPGQVLGTAAIGKEAVMADAVEA